MNSKQPNPYQSPGSPAPPWRFPILTVAAVVGVVAATVTAGVLVTKQSISTTDPVLVTPRRAIPFDVQEELKISTGRGYSVSVPFEDSEGQDPASE